MGHGQTGTRRQHTLRDVKTAVTGRLHSKPSAAGQQYLDLYTLKRDHARWSKMKERAEQMLRSIDKALHKIEPLAISEQDEARDTAGARATIELRTSTKRNAGT